jgi:DNA-binding response OmpR family regulator
MLVLQTIGPCCKRLGTSVGSLGGYSILVVDDEPFVATSVSEALSDAGADVVTAHDLRTALEAAMSGNVSAAILDVTLGGADSGAVCTALNRRHVPFMFLSGYDTHDLLREWASVPALTKPAGEAELVAKVEALLSPTDASR